MYKIPLLIGKWKVKKSITQKVTINGYCFITKISEHNFELKENIKINVNEDLISGYQLFKIREKKSSIIFYFNAGQNQNQKLYTFIKKNTSSESLFFCKKDLYLANFKVINNNFFIMKTKIKGPKKNLCIFAKYYRTI